VKDKFKNLIALLIFCCRFSGVKHCMVIISLAKHYQQHLIIFTKKKLPS